MFKEEQPSLMAIIDSVCTHHAWRGLQVAYHAVHALKHFTEQFIHDLPDHLDCLLFLSETSISDQALADGFQALLKKGGLFRCRGEIQLHAILKQMQQGTRFLEPFILCLFYGSKADEDQLSAFATGLQRNLEASNVFCSPIVDWQALASEHCIFSVSYENHLMQSERTGVWFPTVQSQLYFLNPIGQSLLICGDNAEAAFDFEQRCLWYALASSFSVLVFDARGDYHAFSRLFGVFRVDLMQFSDQRLAFSAVLKSIRRMRNAYLLIQCLSDWQLQDLKTIVEMASERGNSLTLVGRAETSFHNEHLCAREVQFKRDRCELWSRGRRSFHLCF